MLEYSKSETCDIQDDVANLIKQVLADSLGEEVRYSLIHTDDTDLYMFESYIMDSLILKLSGNECIINKLKIDKLHQGMGYGQKVVEALRSLDYDIYASNIQEEARSFWESLNVPESYS